MSRLILIFLILVSTAWAGYNIEPLDCVESPEGFSGQIISEIKVNPHGEEYVLINISSGPYFHGYMPVLLEGLKKLTWSECVEKIKNNPQALEKWGKDD